MSCNGLTRTNESNVVGEEFVLYFLALIQELAQDSKIAQNCKLRVHEIQIIMFQFCTHSFNSHLTQQYYAIAHRWKIGDPLVLLLGATYRYVKSIVFSFMQTSLPSHNNKGAPCTQHGLHFFHIFKRSLQIFSLQQF